VSFYTSLSLAEGEFEQLVMEKLLLAEQFINSDARLRCHVKEDQ